MKRKKLSWLEKICIVGLLIISTMAVGTSLYLLIQIRAAEEYAEIPHYLVPGNKVSLEEVSLSEKSFLVPTGCDLFRPLPELVLYDENEKRVSSKNLRGKVVILDFFASWCPDCQFKIEHLEEVLETIEDYKNVEYYLVDQLEEGKETPQMAKDYLKSKGVNPSILWDKERMVYKQLGLYQIPTTLVVNQEGILVNWYMGEELTGSKIKMMIEDALKGPAEQSKRFITAYLMNDLGGIRTSYLKEMGFPDSEDVLSESIGLGMEIAALSRDRDLFNQFLGYLENQMLYKGQIQWVKSVEQKYYTNAAIDDLRIYNALIEAEKVWGGYKERLEHYKKWLTQYTTKEGQLVDFYDAQTEQVAPTLSLCYSNFKVLKHLGSEDAYWNGVYQRSLEQVKGGYISDQFPFYFENYNYKKKRYSPTALNMAEALITIFHLSEIDEVKQETIDWLHRKIDGEGIYASYKIDGSVNKEYQYESTAIYAVVVLIGNEIGDDDLVNKAFQKMELMRIQTYDEVFRGAFGNTDGTGIYSFDQCMAWLAYTRLEQRKE